MKKFIVLLYICLIPATYVEIFAQRVNGNFGNKQTGSNFEDDDNNDKEKKGKKKSELKLKKWKYSIDFDTIKINRDTNLFLFHVFNPVEKKSISNSFLGNIGLASQSNIFFKRPLSKWNDFFFFKAYDQYFILPEDVEFVKTNHPYTEIMHATTSKELDLQTINFIHTQNINESLNWGIRYNLISSKGQFPNEQSKNNAFAPWISYFGKRYSFYASFNYNRFKPILNGGIVDTGLVDMSKVDVNLTTASSILNNRTFIYKHQYSFGETSTKVINDTTFEEIYKPKIAIIHSLKQKKYFYKYNDTEPDFEYYPAIYRDSTSTNDSVYHSSLENILNIKVIENMFFDGLPAAQAGIGQEISRFFNYTDYIIIDDYRYINTFSNVDIFRRKSSYIQYSANAKYYFSGYKKDDTYLKVQVKKIFNHGKDSTSTLSLSIDYEKYNPGFFDNNYYSNHFKWDNNFDKRQNIKAHIKYEYPIYHFNVGAVYQSMDNYLYFDTLGLPKQYNDNLKVYSAYISKIFNLWVFSFVNKAVYQMSTNDSITCVPMVALYHSTFAKLNLFKKALYTEIGFDVRYSTKHYAYTYQPATSVFHHTKNIMVGDYPIFTIFVNAKIRSALLFFKWEHVNSGMTQIYYSNVKNYPIKNFHFKFGVRWRFHN